jgi:hypothetical protein
MIARPGRRAVGAELARGLTLPATRMLLAVVALLAVAPAALAEMTVTVSASGAGGTGRLADTFGLSLCLTVVSALAAVWAGCDLRSGELGVALMAVPSRTRLAIARAGALSLVVAPTAVIAFAVDRTIRIWTDPDARPGAPGTWRVAVGFVLASVTVALLAAALTTLLRSAMLSIAVLLLVPILVVPLLERVAPVVAGALPFSASGVVVSGAGSVSMGWAAGMAVLLAWAVASAGLSFVLLRRRDL